MRDAGLLPPPQRDRLRARDPLASWADLLLQWRMPLPPRPPRETDEGVERETAPRRNPPVDNTLRQNLQQRTTGVPDLRNRIGQQAQTFASCPARRDNQPAAR